MFWFIDSLSAGLGSIISTLLLYVLTYIKTFIHVEYDFCQAIYSSVYLFSLLGYVRGFLGADLFFCFSTNNSTALFLGSVLTQMMIKKSYFLILDYMFKKIHKL